MNAPSLLPEQAADLPNVPTCTIWQTGLQRYPVDEQKAAARATVEELHEFADMLGLGRNRHGVPVADIARRAAVLLDETQAGHYLFTPEPRSGWTLVPTTTPPKVAAAVGALLSAMAKVDGNGCGDEEWAAAIEGGFAVMRLLVEAA